MGLVVTLKTNKEGQFIKYTNDKFISMCNQVHNFKYDYSLTNYNGWNKKIKIICKKHGVFEQYAGYHLSGRICGKCAIEEKYDIKWFVNKAKEKHGNYYDYSLVKYISTQSNKKIIIICPKHGKFELMAANHIRGAKCPKCSCHNNVKYTKKTYLKKAKEVHGNRYDYSLMDLDSNDGKIDIICLIHGVFRQSYKDHLRGSKCPECAIDQKRNKNFILQANKIHYKKYDYSKMVYKNWDTCVEIVCPIHGSFFQRPGVHLTGAGCPQCSYKSKAELEISNILTDLKIKYIREKKFKDCKNKRPLKFDFYLPKMNMCIEYDGIHHFKAIGFFGGNKNLEMVKKHDFIKSNYCLNKHINLLRIKYTDNIRNVLYEELNKMLLDKTKNYEDIICFSNS